MSDLSRNRVEASDNVLIERSLAGELGAFDLLMVRYQQLVFKVALACVRDRDQALDVSQIAFLKAYERLGSLRVGGSFKSWVARIAYRESLNWIRSRRRDEPLDTAEVERAHIGPATQESTLVSRQTDALVSNLVCGLTRRQRLAVSLRYYEELSIADIAAVLRCSEGTVKNTLFRSMQKLRRRLADARTLQ